ncbi:hypothetical protein AU106_gp072 [Sinorhizobium phage phiM9]|uniref:Uncharacterized protein n=1 Tax=Sinorhizobium phage phiM9 TaxID=1636182 RepID=A0A0F6R7F3_9CAUD|nr:hypothetical protein AU106_gp072 [Sinorhizobium phage phiM9]AKE44703.1 hypothetical protein Sm_phiM9_073 [Sinorhizobium phage phiM9]
MAVDEAIHVERLVEFADAFTKFTESLTSLHVNGDASVPIVELTNVEIETTVEKSFDHRSRKAELELELSWTCEERTHPVFSVVCFFTF